MKQNFFLILFLGFSISSLWAQGYKIKVHIKDVKDSTIQLAYYYSDKQYVVQEQKLDKTGRAIFKDTKALPQGLYIIIAPNVYFDLIINAQQNFSIDFDSRDFQKSVKFKNSKENTAFFSYQNYVSPLIKRQMELQKKLDDKKLPADSIAIAQNQLDNIREDLTNYWRKVAKEYKGSFLSHLLKAMNSDGGKYFDNIDFSDARLLYSPVYYRALQHLLARNINYNTSPQEFMADIDSLLVRAKQNKEVYHFCLQYLLDFLHSYQKIGVNEVFGHLAYNYFLTDTTDWLNDKAKKMIKKTADTWMAAEVGKIAPDLKMQNIDGDTIRLKDIKTRYTLLLFWKTGCGHCLKAVKTLKKFYDQTDDLDLTIFAVYVKSSKSDWESFLDKQDVRNLWINVWDAKDENNFHAKYYVVSTPILYVLDENKKILSMWNGDSGVKQLVVKLEAERDKLRVKTE